MKKSLAAAAALALGLAIAAPSVGWSADEPKPSGDAASQPGGMGGMPGMMGGMREHPQEMGHGMGQRGGMREMMMHRWREMSPRQRCEERLARRAGMIAYTVAKLNLTAEQRPLWDKLQSLLQQAADRERQLCAGLKPASEREQETILDRIGRREQFLSARLQGLQQVRPALEQLYQALSPDQKAIINHPFRP